MAKVYRTVPAIELELWRQGDIDEIRNSGLARELLYEPHAQKSPDMIARLEEKYGSTDGICFFENLDFALWLQSFGWRERLSIALICIDVPDEVLDDCMLVGKYKRSDENFNIAVEYYIPKEVLKKCLKSCKILQSGQKEYEDLLSTCAELRKNMPLFPQPSDGSNWLILLSDEQKADIREGGYGRAFGKYYPLVVNFEYALCFPNMEFLKRHIMEIDFTSKHLGLDILELARKHKGDYVSKNSGTECFVVPKKEDRLIEQIAEFCARNDFDNCSQEEVDKFMTAAADRVLASLCESKKIDLDELKNYQKSKADKALSPEEMEKRKQEFLAKRAAAKKVLAKGD